MKNRNRLKKPGAYLYFLLFVLLFASCEQKMDEYYKIPDWLKGNAWEVLEKRGDFTLFLAAADKAGYRSMLEGKGIITVVAPDDAAFSAWLSQKGYASIHAVPEVELRKVVTFHLLYYSFSKEMLANYRPEGRNSSDYNSPLTAGLYYKFRTNSNEPVSIEEDKTVGANPVERKVFHKERFVPVLSSYIFETLGIDAKSNYEYFYPNSTWTGDKGGFNISNASVTDYAVVTDNGYVYIVDKVLEPLETIYTELQNNTDFSMFYDMYDRFVNFTQNEEVVANYGADFWLKYHTDLPAIASEWTYNGEITGVPDYSRLDLLARDSYSVYAPSNKALQSFFDSFWGDYYPSLDKVNFLPVKYLLDNHVSSGDVIFPELIRQGKIRSKFGNPVDFDTEQTNLKQMCVNGTLFGLNDVMIPKMFQSVTAPAFQNPEYTMFLLMLHMADYPLALMSDNMKFTLFMPTDDLINTTTDRQGDGFRYIGSPYRYGPGDDQVIQNGGGTEWYSLSKSRYASFAANHISPGLMTEVGNQKVYKTWLSYQYLLVEDGNKIYSSNTFNNYKDRPVSIEKIQDAYNGESYRLSGDEYSMALLHDDNTFTFKITTAGTDINLRDFKAFYDDMLGPSGINLNNIAQNFLFGTRYIAFIPDANALSEAEITGLFPVSQQSMDQYVRYCFVNVATNGLLDYPFPGAVGAAKELTTYLNAVSLDPDTGRPVQVPYKLTLIDTGSKLQVKDAKGNIYNVTGIFPNIYTDGAAYLVDGVLEFE